MASSFAEVGAGDDWRFRVQHRQGGATFRIFCLPPGMGERLWESTNKHVGWVASASSGLLQSKVVIKAVGLGKYRPQVDSAVLLIVADRGRASGFFDLDPDVAVDPLGFDSVYFQGDRTWKVAPAPGPAAEVVQGPA